MIFPPRGRGIARREGRNGRQAGAAQIGGDPMARFPGALDAAGAIVVGAAARDAPADLRVDHW